MERDPTKEEDKQGKDRPKQEHDTNMIGADMFESETHNRGTESFEQDRSVKRRKRNEKSENRDFWEVKGEVIDLAQDTTRESDIIVSMQMIKVMMKQIRA